MEAESGQEFTGSTAVNSGGPDIQDISGGNCHASEKHSLG